MAVSNPASALGQEIGKLFEGGVVEGLRSFVKEHNHSIGPEKLVNGTKNAYQIDAVIRDDRSQPVILLDPKYVRYKKHNRDKGSWLCTAHYNLRKTYPSLRKTVAVLAGNWSHTSIALIESFGIEVLHVPFAHMVEVLLDFGVQFSWPEKDRSTPAISLRAFNDLSSLDRHKIAEKLVEPIKQKLISSVREVIMSDWQSSHSRISTVEVLLKTDRNEMLLLQYESVNEAVKGMVEFMTDLSDIKTYLK